MKIYLIRHAKSKDDKKSLVQRLTTPVFIDSETRHKVKEVKNKIGEVDIVFCSPLKRTMQTADLIFGKNNYRVLHCLREYGIPAETIGKPREVHVHFWAVKHKQDRMNIHWTPKGGESFASIAKRVKKFHNFMINLKATKKYNKVAVVGHGTFMRHFLLSVANVPWAKYPRLIFDVLRILKWDNLHVIEVEI